MKRAPLRTSWCATASIAGWVACVATAGCAGPGTLSPSTDGAGSVRAPNGQLVAPQGAMEAVVIGKSTRADVSVALGKAIVVPFDTGYEVWIYRWPGADPTIRGATELVVLFAPSGIVTRARLRPGYASRS